MSQIGFTIEIRFSKRLVFKNGSRLKTLKSMKVPKNITDLYGIDDGMKFYVFLENGNREIDAGVCNVMSGKELYLGKENASKISVLDCETLNFRLLPITNEEMDNTIYDDIAKARKLKSETLKNKINSAPEYPSYSLVMRYNRSPYVIAEVLSRANNKCESCNADGPFRRLSDSTVYLEVHHIKPLSQRGRDRPDNCMALCPNCHREAHHGSRGLDLALEKKSLS